MNIVDAIYVIIQFLPILIILFVIGIFVKFFGLLDKFS